MFVLSARSIIQNMLRGSLCDWRFSSTIDSFSCVYNLMCSLVPHLCVLKHLCPSHLQRIVSVKRKCSAHSWLHTLHDSVKYIFIPIALAAGCMKVYVLNGIAVRSKQRMWWCICIWWKTCICPARMSGTTTSSSRILQHMWGYYILCT